MPIQDCTKNGKPGIKYGNDGFCYTYDPNDDNSKRRAREKAKAQGRAIKQSQNEN